MQKILLLDADGVVLPKTRYFSERYAEHFGVSAESLKSFFKNELRDCQLGTKDLRIVLPRYFNDWQWQGTVDELLQYWFQDGNQPEPEILTLVEQTRAAGIKCYLATDQEKYRAHYLWQNLELSKHFDGSFFSCDLGARKNETVYWEKVLAKLGNPDPAEVVFWDDELENVATAKQAGIEAHLFTQRVDFKKT